MFSKSSYTPVGDGETLFVYVVVALILVWISLSLRLWVRAAMIKSMGVDDYLMITAVIIYTYLSGGCIALAVCGLGRHARNIPVQALVCVYKCYLIDEFGYVLGSLFFRLSVCWFYLRITVAPWQTWLVRTLALINVLYSIAYFFVLLFQCSPVSYYWTRARQYAGEAGPPGNCIPSAALLGVTYGHSGIAIASDWTLNTLPLFIIGKSGLDMRTKVSVLLLLGMGLVASIGSIVRCTTIWSIQRNADFTHTSAPIAIWSCVEISIGILAANIATYRPLFRTFFVSVTGGGDGQRPRMTMPSLRTWFSSRDARFAAGMNRDGSNSNNTRAEQGSSGGNRNQKSSFSSSTQQGSNGDEMRYAELAGVVEGFSGMSRGDTEANGLL